MVTHVRTRVTTCAAASPCVVSVEPPRPPGILFLDRAYVMVVCKRKVCMPPFSSVSAGMNEQRENHDVNSLHGWGSLKCGKRHMKEGTRQLTDVKRRHGTLLLRLCVCVHCRQRTTESATGWENAESAPVHFRVFLSFYSHFSCFFHFSDNICAMILCYDCLSVAQPCSSTTTTHG